MPSADNGREAGETDNREMLERIGADPAFVRLAADRSRLGWSLMAVLVFFYFGFILMMTLAPDLVASAPGESSVLTYGLWAVFLIITLAVALTWVYVRRADTDFDPRNDEILKRAGLKRAGK